MRVKFAATTLLIAGGATSALAWPHIHISPPHVFLPHISPPHLPIPHVNVGPFAITPLGPVPKAAIAPAQKVLDTGVNNGVKVATAVVTAQVAPQVAVINVVAGKENLTDAAKSVIIPTALKADLCPVSGSD